MSEQLVTVGAIQPGTFERFTTELYRYLELRGFRALDETSFESARIPQDQADFPRFYARLQGMANMPHARWYNARLQVEVGMYNGANTTEFGLQSAIDSFADQITVLMNSPATMGVLFYTSHQYVNKTPRVSGSWITALIEYQLILFPRANELPRYI